MPALRAADPPRRRRPRVRLHGRRGAALQRAATDGWTVVSIKNDWATRVPRQPRDVARMPTLELAPSLRNYDRAWLSKDIVGGLAAGAVVIPQAMAYATIADLPVQVGSTRAWCRWWCTRCSAVRARCRCSTTSTIAVLTGSTLIAGRGRRRIGDDPARDLATLTLLVGVILLVARLLRLGALIDNISEATLVGIKIGVGLTVAAGQLPKLLGITGDPTADNFFSEMEAVFDHLGDISCGHARVLGGDARRAARRSSASCRGFPARSSRWSAASCSSPSASIDEHGVALIAPVPSGLPTPVVPDVERIERTAAGRVRDRDHGVPRDPRRRPRGASPHPSRRSTTTRSSSPAASPAPPARSSGRCRRRAASRRPRSTSGRAPAPSSASSSPSCSPSRARSFLGRRAAATCRRRRSRCMVVIAVLGLIEPPSSCEFWTVSRIEFWVAVVTAVSGLVLRTARRGARRCRC